MKPKQFATVHSLYACHRLMLQILRKSSGISIKKETCTGLFVEKYGSDRSNTRKAFGVDCCNRAMHGSPLCISDHLANLLPFTIRNHVLILFLFFINFITTYLAWHCLKKLKIGQFNQSKSLFRL